MFLQLCVNYLQCIFATVLAWIGVRVPQVHGTSQLSSTGKVNPATIKVNNIISQAAATPSSVNYHFTRQCNYKCGFCFHTAKTSFVLPIEEAKRGLQLLKKSGKFAQRLYLCYFKSIFKFT
uniref:Radical SAM core domain-containing protein n=1 Tax=Hucho hucho TaxID=62062 RepID=A0A4W5KS48_9TELE